MLLHEPRVILLLVFSPVDSMSEISMAVYSMGFEVVLLPLLPKEQMQGGRRQGGTPALGSYS
jgi:hypothetical protein